MLGVNSRAKRGVMQHYISDSIYGLTLAWITSENSTKQLECRHLDSIFFAGPYLLLNRLSAVPSPTACQLLCPTNSLLASRYLFRPRRDFKFKNPLSGFAPKQTKESSAWRATYIVLQWSVSVGKLQSILCISSSWIDSVLYIISLSAWTNSNSLHNSQWITFPTQSSFVLYSFCASLLHSLIMYWKLSYLSPHGRHLLFFIVLPIFALIQLILRALICVAINRFLSWGFSFLPVSMSSHKSVPKFVTCYYYNHFTFERFHTSVRWWYFTGVCVTESLLKSLRILLSVLVILITL